MSHKFNVGDIVVKVRSAVGHYIGKIEAVDDHYISGLILHDPKPQEYRSTPEFGDHVQCYKLFEEVSKVEYLMLTGMEKPHDGK